VALDAQGRQLATMVHAKRGNVVDAQVTDDHRALWYLSVQGKAGVDCGEVVRADVSTGKSTIVARAVAFAISRDGRSLAVYGYGSVETRRCETGKSSATASIDLQTNDVIRNRLVGVRDLVYSPDGYPIARSCRSDPCSIFVFLGHDGVYDWTPVTIEANAIAWSDSELYAISPSRRQLKAYVWLPRTIDSQRVVLRSRTALEQVAPTEQGVYVVAKAPSGKRQLYLVSGSRLVPLTTADPGRIVAVPRWNGRWVDRRFGRRCRP
jgi:hypothetical protein